MATETIPKETTLPRVLGPVAALCVVVGSVIGSGIFMVPSDVARATPAIGPIVAVWIVGGIFSTFGALTLAELGAMLPQAGGPYVYLREAYGRLPAFLFGWSEFWVVRTGSIGALSCATVIYLDAIQPMTLLTHELLAISIVVVLSVINIISTRWVTSLQN